MFVHPLYQTIWYAYFKTVFVLVLPLKLFRNACLKILSHLLHVCYSNMDLVISH